MMELTMLLGFTALSIATVIVCIKTKADVIVFLGVLTIAIASATIGITAAELRCANNTKKMTVNYEFRDSVYIPVDTTLNN